MPLLKLPICVVEHCNFANMRRARRMWGQYFADLELAVPHRPYPLHHFIAMICHQPVIIQSHSICTSESLQFGSAMKGNIVKHGARERSRCRIESRFCHISISLGMRKTSEGKGSAGVSFFSCRHCDVASVQVCNHNHTEKALFLHFC